MASLQNLSDILSNSWACSVAFDSATIQTASHFDVLVRVCKGTDIFCFHLFSLPLYGSHTAELMFSVFSKAMDSFCPSWPHRLLSTCSDGARNITGPVRGIITRAANRVGEEGCNLIRFWCGAHQLHLVVQNAAAAYCDSEFYTTPTGLIGYLRRQQNLVNEMRSKCPTVATTRWLFLVRVLNWIENHRDRITSYLHEKTSARQPPKVWWITLLALSAIFTEVDILFKTIQDSALFVYEQKASFNSLFPLYPTLRVCVDRYVGKE